MAESIAIALAEAGAINWGTASLIAEYAAYINFAAATVASSAYSAKQRRKARDAYNASLKGREVMIQSAVAPRRRVYGRDRISGPIVYAQTTGDKGQYLHLVVALADHECDAIEQIYFNDEAMVPDVDGWITSGPFAKVVAHSADHYGTPSGGSITLPHAAASITAVTRSLGDSGPISTSWTHTPGSAVVSDLPTDGSSVIVSYVWAEQTNLVRIKRHLGQAGQVADADLVAESGGKWTSAHKGTGICYLYARLEYDPDVFGQVGLPQISAVVRGAKLRDPRDESVAWTENVALIIADWLQEGSMGLDAETAEVPDAEVIAAANVCDESIDLGDGDYQDRYTFNGSVTADMTPRAMLDDLAQAMAGSVVWVQGRWLVRPGVYRTPALTINEDSLAGASVRIMPRPSRSDLINTVRATYRDPSQGWAEVQAPESTSATYQAQDGGKQIARDVQYASAMDSMRAQRLEKIELERHRQALTVQLTTSLKGFNLLPTDVVTLQLTRYGWSAGKSFEVLERKHDIAAATIDYTLRETAVGVYEWAYGEATVIDLAPDTELASPYSRPADLGGLTLTVGPTANVVQGDGTTVPGIIIEWPASADAYVSAGGRIDVQWRTQAGEDWISAPAESGASTGTRIAPLVADGTLVLIRARAVRGNGVASDWIYSSTVPEGSTSAIAVAGLTGTVTKGFIVWSWTQPTSTLYASTELRQGGTGWDDATTVWGGGANSWTQRVTSAGSYTIRAKHRTHAWTPSATAGSATVTVAPEDLVLDGAPGADGDDGAPGVNAATVWLFQRTGSATPPAVPSGDVTYTFSTSVATGIGSWAQALPGSGGSYRWFTTATASASTATDTIATGEWATPRLMSDATGALAGLDTVGTGEIDTGAVTDTAVATVSSFTATSAGDSHTPDGEAYRESVISLSYTPPVDCIVDLVATGLWEYTTASGGTGLLSLTGGINIGGSWSASNDSFFAFENAGTSQTRKGSLISASTFTLTGGVAYTFKLLLKYQNVAGGDAIALTQLKLARKVYKR